MRSRVLLVFAVAIFAGCGDKPTQTTDEKALEEERTKGKELRENLEGYKPPKK